MIRFQDHIGLVHLHAKKGYKWAEGAGCGLDYDDLFQTASVAFCIAVDGFKPEMGLRFSTYYSTVVFSEFRREIGIMTGVKNLNPAQRSDIEARNEQNRQRAESGLAPLPACNYGIRATPFSSMATLFEDEVFEDHLAGDMDTPEEELAFKQTWFAAIQSLSPLAQLMLDWLQSPPPELVREVEAQAAHADVRLARGLRGQKGGRDGVNLASIKKFLMLVADMPKEALMLAEAELMKVVQQLEEM